MLVDEGVPEMMEFEWVGWNRHYFIAEIVSMEEIEAVLRQIWRQFAADVNVDDHMVDLETPNPVAADV